MLTSLKQFVVLITLTYAFNAVAQNSFDISGKVTDKKKEALPHLNLVVFRVADSSFVTGTSTKNDGSFIIRFVQQGEYLIRLSHVGFLEKSIPVSVSNKNLDMGVVIMEQLVLELQQATIEGTQIPVVQKGDTTEYNASSFKVNPDATAEDLIAKMPGITVDDDNVQAHGEDVKKVTVDGEEFFGDDASIALKNLPAEIISKIQVFDKQSDQAQFTGIMDANTIKTINIITKNPDAKFFFGRAYTGYGTDERYNIGGNLNFFNGKQRITLLGTSNNINRQNFSSEDLLGVTTGRGMGMGGRPPGVGGRSPFGQSGNDFFVGTQDGINKTHSLGLNYIDKWGTDITVNGSYFYNQTDNENTTNTIRNYYFPISDSASSTYVEDKLNESSNLNHRLKLKMDYKINYSNRLIFTPKLSFQTYEGFENIGARNLTSSFETVNETATENGIHIS